MLPYESLPTNQPGRGFEHLAGVRIVDLTTSVAGPYATQLLADFGATVIKIEKPGTGDDARQWGPPFLQGESLWFMSVNRNKQSLCLDVSDPQGYEVILKVLEQADVLVLNMTPRVQQKLGLSYQILKDRFPRLIHGSLTGFGLEGPRKDWACYDLIAEGYSGIMDLTGEPDSDAQKVGTPAADLLAGYDLALAIMACLHERARTGAGSQIDISMIRSMTRFVAPRIMSYLGSGEVPRRSGGKDSVIAIYQVFETADLPLSLGLGNDGIWNRFWQAVGDTDFAKRDFYKDNAARRERRAEIVEHIAAILKTKPRHQWLELFATHRIPAGPINRVDEITEDPDMLASGFFERISVGERDIPQVGLGIHVNGQSQVLRSLPPTLGENTDQVLRDIGLDENTISKLREAGIVS